MGAPGAPVANRSGPAGRLFAVLAVLAVVTLVHLAVPTYPDYDAYANLGWGAALAEGLHPNLEEPLAPTPHPLMIAAGAALSLVGTGGDRVYSILVLAAWFALVVACLRIGRATLGTAPAVVGAVLVAAAPALLVLAVGAGTDVPFLALVAWALSVEVRAPGRQARRVLVLLALAGLLRPEGWLLAGAYVAWQTWRTQRVDTVAVLLAAAAPVLWVALDVALTGDPLHSLTHTTALADELGRSRSPAQAPLLLVKALAHLLTPPGFALSLVGLALALRLRRERVDVLLALLGVGALFFALIVAAGFSAVDRYAWLAALPLFLFAGYGLVGFLQQPPGRLRGAWMRAAGTAVTIGIVGLAIAPPDVGRIHRELVDEPAAHAAYAAIMSRDAVRAGAHCGPVRVDGYYRIGEARWALREPTADVRPWRDRTAGTGVLILPVAIDRLPRDDPAASGANRAFLAASRTGEVSAHGLHAYIVCPTRR
jgi:hypothetical protein